MLPTKFRFIWPNRQFLFLIGRFLKIVSELFNLFSQSKCLLELSHIFKSVVFGNDGKGISFKNRLKRAFKLAKGKKC